MAVVGTAVIDVIANTAKFMAGMAAAERRIGSLKSVIDTLAAAGLAKMTRDALRSADAIGDTARAAELSTRAYQELSYAAKRLDVDQSALDSGLLRLKKTLGDVKRTGEGGVFKELGIDPRFLTTTEQAFDAVMAKLRGIRDESVRSSFAIQVFGKEAGEKLAQMAATSAKDLALLRQEASNVGAVLSDEVITKADGAETKLASLALVTRTQMTVALVELTPVITTLGEAAAMSAKGWALLSEQIKVAYEWFEKWLRRGDQGFDPTKTNEAHRKKVQELRDVYAELNLSIARVEARGGASSQSVIKVLSQRRDEVKRELDALEGQKRALKEETKGGGDPTKTPYVSTVATMKDAAALEEHINGIYERNIQLLTGKNAAQLQYEATLTDLNELLARGTITQEEYNAAVGRAQTEFEKTGNAMTVFADQAARNMQSAFADFLFDPFEDGLKGMLRSFGQTIQRMVAEAASARIFEAFGVQGFISGMFGAPASTAAPAGRASGGPVSPGMMYEINERGSPEVLSADGRDYLLMGSKGGRVSAAGAGGGGVVMPMVQIVNNGAPVKVDSQETARAPDGRMIERIVISAIERDAASGGPGIRAIQRATGTRRQGRTT